MKREIKNISVILNLTKPQSIEVFNQIIKEGEKYGLNFFLQKDIANQIGVTGYGVSDSRFKNECDMVLAVGGDGTFINAAHHFSKVDVPLLGVHIGGLGFLTEIKVSEISETIKNIVDGNFIIEERLMLEAKVINGKKVRASYIGLNEIVVHKGSFTRIIKLSAYINKQYVGTFEGDGMIVSTPTGSTGYSLSADGPIVVPGMDVFIINTICPHTFGVRPIVVSSSSLIDIIVTNDNCKMSLGIDGIHGIEIFKDDVVSITKSKYKTKLIKSPKRNFFDILREKFEWVK